MKTLVRTRFAATGETNGAPTPAPAASVLAQPVHAPLPLVALVLGVSGVALGLTVIWFFAAIPIGIAAAVVGFVALRRIASTPDPRARSRAVIGAVLGLVAILLGITGGIFLPKIMDRADRFFGSVQDDVNANVRLVNDGTQRDVDRLDATLTHDLNRFERQNHEDLTALEQRTSAALTTLEARMAADLKSTSTDAKTDLDAAETELRAAIRALEAALRSTESTLNGKISALDARITRIEHELGL